MTIKIDHAIAASGTFGRSDTEGMPADFAVVCLWSFLGLDLTALIIALGFGAQLAEIFSIAG